MDNLGILDLVIGLFFVYFVFSVICTAIVEGIAQLRDLRSSHLKKWVIDTFSEALGNQLLKHGLIKGLTQKTKKADYLPAEVFSAALFDLVYSKFREDKKANQEPQLPTTYDFDRLEAAMLNPNNPLPEDMKHYLLQAFEDSKINNGSILLIKKRLEDWYANAMELVIGTYKKRARVITFVVALVVTLLTNADTIVLSKYLNENPQATAKLVLAAEQAMKDSIYYKQSIESLKTIRIKIDSIDKNHKDSTLQSEANRTISKIKEKEALIVDLYSSLYNTGLPLGWEHGIPDCPEKCKKDAWAKVGFYARWSCFKLIGLLLTALALTLGAPFWFDTINKLVNIRSAGKKPEEMAAAKQKITPAG